MKSKIISHPQQYECKFCQKSDRGSLKVICKNNCLVCYRCLHQTSVRNDIFGKFKNSLLSSINQDESQINDFFDQVCPCCNSPINRSFLFVLRSIIETEKVSTSNEVSYALYITLILRHYEIHLF